MHIMVITYLLAIVDIMDMTIMRTNFYIMSITPDMLTSMDIMDVTYILDTMNVPYSHECITVRICADSPKKKHTYTLFKYMAQAYKCAWDYLLHENDMLTQSCSLDHTDMNVRPFKSMLHLGCPMGKEQQIPPPRRTRPRSQPAPYGVNEPIPLGPIPWTHTHNIYYARLTLIRAAGGVYDFQNFEQV